MSDRYVPDGWVKTSPLELAHLVRGVSYEKDEVSLRPSTGRVPILRAGNISAGVSLDDLQYVPSERVSAAQMLRLGDVVIAMSSGSKAVVGKAAQLDGEWEGSFGAFCGVLRPSKLLDHRYFGLFFRTKEYRDQISELSAGTNINNLKREYFDQVPLSLPPLAEQSRIVEKVEALLARVDSVRGRLEGVQQLFRRFRQAVLAAACDGRLTEGWREEGDRAKWRDTNLRDIVVSLDQGWSPKCEISAAGVVEWGVIKTTAVQPMHFIPEENKALPKALQPRPELEVRSGDLLITRAGPRARAGVACLVRSTRHRLMICDKVYRFRLNEGAAKPAFVEMLLNTGRMLEIIDELKTGISDSGVNLTQDKFLDLTVSLPSLAEQTEIVGRVEAIVSLSKALERRIASALARAEILPQAILVRAFNGELVPTEAELARAEGRDYETAGQLLDRIHRERVAAAPAQGLPTVSGARVKTGAKRHRSRSH